MTPELITELDKWAAQSSERQAIEDFIERMEMQGEVKWMRFSHRSLETLLDEFFSVDRSLLEAARRTLLKENML